MGTLGYSKSKLSAEFCQHLALFPRSLFLCPSLLPLFYLPLVSIPFLMVVSPFHFFAMSFTFVFFTSFIVRSSFSSPSSLLKQHSDLCQSWY